MSIVLDSLAAPFALHKLQKARRLLETVTPLVSDCGRLCGGACCQPDDTGENGMLLLPFEDRFYRKPIAGFHFTLKEDDRLFKGGKRLVCEGVCPREHRPIACRIFPLRMRVTLSQQEEVPRVTAELDPRAWAVCPLLEQGGLRAMRKEFIAAVEQTGQLLCQNVYMLQALLREQEMMEELCRF